MRWIKADAKSPEITIRFKRMFLFIPKTIGKEKRWLEYVQITEMWDNGKWIESAFCDSKPQKCQAVLCPFCIEKSTECTRSSCVFEGMSKVDVNNAIGIIQRNGGIKCLPGYEKSSMADVHQKRFLQRQAGIYER